MFVKAVMLPFLMPDQSGSSKYIQAKNGVEGNKLTVNFLFLQQ
jgi:hypothetical protein